MVLASWSPSMVFFVPLFSGFIASLAVTGLLMWRTKITQPPSDFDPETHDVGSLSRAWWHQSVWTSAAWTFKDSWATNITAVGAALGVIAGSNSALIRGSLNNAPHELVSLGVIFGGASVLAPLVYAALAKEPRGIVSDSQRRATVQANASARLTLGPRAEPSTTAPTSLNPTAPPFPTQVEGTIGGLLVASATTLFATLGGLAALITWAQDSNLDGAEAWSLTSVAVVAAVFVGIYAVRSFHALATFATIDGATPRPSFISSTGVSATL